MGKSPSTRVRAAAAAAAALLATGTFRRSRRLRGVATAMHDTVSPSSGERNDTRASSGSSDGHAPGHQHLAPPPAKSSPLLAYRNQRRWAQVRRRSSGRTP